MTQSTISRAPKGGITINGVFYHGGQFLPSNNEPKRGMYNRKSSKQSIRESRLAQYQIVRKRYENRIMAMERVWKSPRMTVNKEHDYAHAHAIQVFEWHQKNGWYDEN